MTKRAEYAIIYLGEFSMNSIIDPFERFDLNIMEAGYDSVDSSWHRFVTFFPYYRIYYIVSGHALIYLQDEVLELFPGKMYFIPAFSVFDAHCDEILTHYWIHLNLDTITEKYLTICRPKNQAETLSTDENIFRMVVDSVKKPGKEKSIRDAVASEGLSKYLFSRFLPERENIAASEGFRFIPVLQYIEKNFDRPITNLELGQILYLSPTYFSNLFTKQFGVSPQKYILQKRLNSAAILLFESTKSIKEIAFECGFDNEAYFNRQFRKFMGVPPGKYRKLSFSMNS